MPKRTDIHKILLLGSGPIVIGQACEFDYSGTQACKTLKDEGFEVVLINSNPATIMTDPEFADRTYLEPLVPEIVAQIIERERPDAILPTLGGQTALNLAVALAEQGVLEKFGVILLGANLESIKKAEDRALFKKAMLAIGLDVPKSSVVTSLADGKKALGELGLPVILRPSFTLGGTGGNIAYSEEEFLDQLKWGLKASPTHQVLIEESVLGWKEFELEVMRDKNDNVVIVCSIENFDPMGIHTGDSVTVAPAQTLTDKEYQIMRNAALAIIREIGVDTGGSNIQFAVNPKNGRMVVVEMNPRVSRSSALASKATGFPIAKFATKLAIGYTLDEIQNTITQKTPACFEPSIDYVVTKIPRFTFEKFPQAETYLTTQMKSVGEAMGIGRTFKESLNKAIRSMEIDRYGLGPLIRENSFAVREELLEILKKPTPHRLLAIAEAFRQGHTLEEVHELTKVDPWFLHNVKEIADLELELCQYHLKTLPEGLLRRAKETGFSDRYLATCLKSSELKVRQERLKQDIRPVFKRVDTCAAEFEAHTPYLYSTYESEDESVRSSKKKVMILGGGPNRIGQGIEFDYCCVHASYSLQEEGYETIMVNCNPETVSTDYDSSDKLYFEPLTFEDVMNIVETERPNGVIVQFGGQTPLKLALALEKAGAPIIGTSPRNIDKAEDRERFSKMLNKLGLKQPQNGIAHSEKQAEAIAKKIGFPVVVRPSYVLGGRAMEIVHDLDYLKHYMKVAVEASPEHPILIDKFLKAATEIDVDCLCDGDHVFIGGVMEHIEEAGVHSGDSTCCLPPHSLTPRVVEEIKRQTSLMALELGVVGLMNVQYAIQGEDIYVLEVNPRASRTVPFVSKATGIPLAKMAAKLMVGRSLKDLGMMYEKQPRYLSVKAPVFPFSKFPGVDPLLGPEMKSTGEVMGIDYSFGSAFGKAQMAASNRLPLSGKVFLSVRDSDKQLAVNPARLLAALGFELLSTRGTAEFLKTYGIKTSLINKVKEGSPHIVEALERGEVALVLNTTEGKGTILDSFSIRRSTLQTGTPYFTNIYAIRAAAEAIKDIKGAQLSVRSIQEYHKTIHFT